MKTCHFFLTVLSVFFLFNSISAQTSYEETYSIFEDALASKNYPDARDILEKQLETDPENAYLYYLLLAKIYMASEDQCTETKSDKWNFDLLILDNLESAIKMTPENTEHLVKLVEYYRNEMPKIEETSEIRKEGEEVQVGCWVNRTTFVRYY